MILTSVSPKPNDQMVISFCFSQIQFTQYQVEDSIRSNISIRHHKAHYPHVTRQILERRFSNRSIDLDGEFSVRKFIRNTYSQYIRVYVLQCSTSQRYIEQFVGEFSFHFFLQVRVILHLETKFLDINMYISSLFMFDCLRLGGSIL